MPKIAFIWQKYYISWAIHHPVVMHRKSYPTVLKWISASISLLCVILIILHAVFPQFAIDMVTVALIVILIFPWLLPYIANIKLPGGIEITTREVEQLERAASKLVPLRRRARRTTEQRLYLLFNEDPNLALAYLRMEIEKRLREIALKRRLDVEMHPLSYLLRNLLTQKIIDREEFDALQTVIRICNKAVHSEKVNPEIAFKIIDIGIRLLNYLDSKVE